MSFQPARPDPGIPIEVNLSSDTQTLPTVGMKAAMVEARLGDEQAGSDPTVWALCDRVAASLGKEAAMFLPSGTMANQVAMATHCRPGDEVLAHEEAHIITSEAGACQAIAGVMVRGLPGGRGQFDTEALEAAIRPHDRYSPPQSLVAVEQTANRGGGSCWPVARLNAVAALARGHGMATHMDGARLLNAAVALETAPAEIAAGYDTVWLDFTKGLGAPLGAVLCGTAQFIGEAWRWKQRLGGSLRQGGICAAACLYALDHHVERLAEDHANARALARGLAQIPGLAVEAPETNLVFFDTEATGMTAGELAAGLRARGVLISTAGRYRGRACLHLDVAAGQVERTLGVVREVVMEQGRG
ncbi:MAG: threonine aldolase family protein [Acetobacteraceae bacterium]|nr:threonine aldolase family protein [Acetobacteraceae bacterium]